MNDRYKEIITEENYNLLKSTGMFYEFYPELTGNWYVDKRIILKPSYNDEINYEGYENEEILLLTNEINNYKLKINELEQRIIDIQDNCKHEYLFYCSGVYNDNYICKHCGKEIEK